MLKTLRMTSLGALLLVAAVLAWANQASAQPASPDAVTLTGPAPNTVIAESDDYATQVLQDPWDMNNIDDMDQPYNITNQGVNNGIWSGTSNAPYPSVQLQYQNYDVSYSYLGEDDGVNHPVDSNRFNRLMYRMYVPTAGNSLLYAFKHYTYAPAANSNFMPAQPGWHIYSVDLRAAGSGGSGTWTQNGPYEGLRFDPASPNVGTNIQVDWIRLTPDTGTPVRITWNGANGNVNLYLSYNPVATDGNEYLIATVPGTSGAYTWNSANMAPGSYYIHAESAGSWSSIGPLVVNAAPLVRVDAPGPLSGEEYSYAVQAEPWDGTNPNQFDMVHNVTNLTFSPSQISAVPTSNDPGFSWLRLNPGQAIDANKYHYFNVKFWVSPPSVRPYAAYNAGTRILWGGPDNNIKTTEIILAGYNRWIPAAYDMRSIEQVGSNPNNWGGLVSTFRWDPLEEDDVNGQPAALPADFRVQAAHLTSDPVAGHTGGASSGLFGTFIRWTPLQGNGGITIYGQARSEQGTVQPDAFVIASDVPMTAGEYMWDTAAIAPGTYDVYMDVQDGRNASRAYALAPIVVTRTQPSTMFNDVPGNLWAIDFVNRLARLGIIGGIEQPDTVVLFKPNNSATRGQLSKMVVLAAGWPLLNPGTPTFNDVQPGSTFYQVVETAADRGVISGYDCGGPNEPCPGRYFRPGNSVTRGQTTKMIMIAFGLAENTSGGPHFSDVAPGSTFYANVETLYNLGIIGGYSDGTFRPGALVTRAQLAKMLSLALDIN